MSESADIDTYYNTVHVQIFTGNIVLKAKVQYSKLYLKSPFKTRAMHHAINAYFTAMTVAILWDFVLLVQIVFRAKFCGSL